MGKLNTKPKAKASAKKVAPKKATSDKPEAKKDD